MKLYLLFATMFCWFSCYSQTAVIVSQTNEAPVEHVAVFNPSMTISGISDKHGKIMLDGFMETDTVIFQHPGFRIMNYTKLQIAEAGYKVVLNKKDIELEELVVFASRFEEKIKEVPFKMDVTGSKDIALLNPPTSAEVLQASGNISVQKSQAGGGSPVIRGFEANKVLLVLDGIRMNNAVYRSGHLQNVITVDHSILDRTEVIFGPASVMYGSDALGGVMQFFTRNPMLQNNDSAANVALSAYMRFASANNENTTHIDFNIGVKKFAMLSSITHSDFNNLRMGKTRHRNYPDFGKVDYYAGTFNGKDTMLVNPDKNIQPNTGYNQVNYVQKFLYSHSEKFNLLFNFQYTTSSDISRFDQLNDYNGDSLRFSEWRYGPQKLFFTSLTATYQPKSKLFDIAKLAAAFQRIDEERITRKFGDIFRLNRKEDVDVYSINLDFSKQPDADKSMKYGFEATYNNVLSSAFSENITDSSLGYASTRYPDGGSTMQTYSAYISYSRKLHRKILFNSGVRYSHTILNSSFNDTTLYKLPFEKIQTDNGALTGSLGLVYNLTSSTRLSCILSSGFRSPNVDDFGKIFSKDDYVIIPNHRLKSEYVYNAETGIQQSFGDFVKADISVWYDYITDAMVRRNSTLNGEDSMFFDGERLRIQANTNAEEAFVYGISAAAEIRFSPAISLNSAINYTVGRNISEKLPLAHIPPVFGRTELSYLHKRLISRVYSVYNGWKYIKAFSLAGEDNAEEATINGSPSWVTLNFAVSYKLKLPKIYSAENFVVTESNPHSGFIIQLGIENILDRHYKTFASGISSPGRNFIVTARAVF